MLLDEVEGALRCLQPHRVLLYIIICIGAYKGESTLKPHRLGGIDQTSISIKTSVNTTVYLIPSMLHPEWHDVLCQISLIRFCPLLNIFFYVHSYWF